MRVVARVAIIVAAALTYSLAFAAVALVAFALTHDEAEPSESTRLSLNDDGAPTWMGSLYVAGLIGVVYLVGFRAWRQRR